MNGEKSSGKVTSEIWKPVRGYEEFYEVSNKGNVRSTGRHFLQRHYSGIMARHYMPPKEMKLRKERSGYVTVSLCDRDGHQTKHLVHRMVADAFLHHPEGKDYVNHLDSNRWNNVAENLEWCTQSENALHGYRYGHMIPPHQKKVAQCDESGNCIKTWESVAKAQRALRINNVSAVCRGVRDHAGGYIWRYIE